MTGDERGGRRQAAAWKPRRCGGAGGVATAGKLFGTGRGCGATAHRDGSPYRGAIGGLTEDFPAAGFEFLDGKGAGGDAFHGDADREGGAQASGEIGGRIGGGVERLEAEADLGEGGALVDLDLVFADAAVGADDGVDGGGVEVHAADDDHVVGAAEDAAVEGEGDGGR